MVIVHILQGNLKQYLEKITSNTSLERLGRYKTLKMNDGSYIQSTTFQTNQTYGNNNCINQDGYLAMTPAATLPATLGLNRIRQRLGIDVIFISKSNFIGYLRIMIILNGNDRQF